MLALPSCSQPNWRPWTSYPYSLMIHTLGPLALALIATISGGSNLPIQKQYRVHAVPPNMADFGNPGPKNVGVSVLLPPPSAGLPPASAGGAAAVLLPPASAALPPAFRRGRGAPKARPFSKRPMCFVGSEAKGRKRGPMCSVGREAHGRNVACVFCKSRGSRTNVTPHRSMDKGMMEGIS